MKFKLRAFVVWLLEEPKRTIIVADYDRACAYDTASKFWGCTYHKIQGCVTAQRNIRNMKSPGVAWVVDLVPVRPPRKTFNSVCKLGSEREYLTSAILRVLYEPATVINKKLR